MKRSSYKLCAKGSRMKSEVCMVVSTYTIHYIMLDRFKTRHEHSNS